MDHDLRSTERKEKRPNDLSTSSSSMMHRKPQRKKIWSNKLLISIVLLSSIGLGVGFFHLSQTPVNEANLPVIMEAKEDACIKVRPNASDNTSVPYSNISIYSELEEHSKEPVVEQLLPETEKPALAANTETENMDTPPIEIVQLEVDQKDENSADEKLMCQIDTPKSTTAIKAPTPEQPPQKAPSKTRESLNEAMSKTMRNIYNEANSMIVENVTHGKKMPNIAQSNANLKIVAKDNPVPVKETILVSKSTSKETNSVDTKKLVPAAAQPFTKSSGKNYWVEFKTVSTSKDAESMWHQLATNKSAKAALVGVQHKVQKQSSEDGAQGYRLTAGPYTKEEAIACCQQLRKTKVNCRVIKK